MVPGCLYHWQHEDESAHCVSLLNIFLYAVVLTYSESLTLKHGAAQAPTEILSSTNTSQVYRPSGNPKSMSRISQASWRGTVQLSLAKMKAEMKPLLALQGENMLQWTRSTEQHTAEEMWNHLSLVLGPSQLSPCTPKTNEDHENQGWRDKCDFGKGVGLVRASHANTWHVVLDMKVSAETSQRLRSFRLDRGVRLTFSPCAQTC